MVKAAKANQLKEFDYDELGSRIYRRRNQLGLTQSEVCEVVGISNTYYSNLERGNAKGVTFGVALNILVNALDFDLTELANDQYWKVPEEE